MRQDIVYLASLGLGGSLSQAIDQKPWLSILVSAFNVEDFIEECLGSILPQISGECIELIVLDDASTDNTTRLISDFQRFHREVRFERAEVNAGVCESRNWLLNQARGDYIWFVDADDRMCAGAVGSLKKIVAEHAPDIVLCDFRRLPLYPTTAGVAAQHATFAGPSRQVLSNRSHLLAGLYTAGHMQLWSKVFRHHLRDPGTWMKPGTHFEDIAFSAAIACNAVTYYHEPSVWIEYRENPTSVVQTMTMKKYVEMADAIKRALDRLERHRSTLEDMVFSAFAMFRDRHFVVCYRGLLHYPSGAERSRTLAAILALYRQSVTAGERRAFRYLKNLEIKKYIRMRKWEMRARRGAAI